MNRITKFINAVDDWLSPLSELVKDETFRGELLASAGAVEKKKPEDKAKAQEKLNFILDLLNKLRLKLGLDKSDIPNVSNIVGLVTVLQELFLVYQAIDELLKHCDFPGAESEADVEQASKNAQRAIMRFLTQTALKKRAPEMAALFDAMGIFSDESNELNRALDLLLFPILVLLRELDESINPDSFRPVGDLRLDEGVRFTKGSFLLLSIGSLFISKKIKPVGTFLLNFGHELAPDKDRFPEAAKVAGRVIQLHFQPGDYSNREEDVIIHDYPNPKSADAFLSFASIPVFDPAVPEPDLLNPAGYQYLMSLEINPGEISSGIGDFSISFPSSFVGNLIWGHNTKLHAFSSGVFGPDPLVMMRLAGKTPQDGTEEPDVRTGDIFFKIHPKVKDVDGSPEIDVEFTLQFQDFQLAISGEGRDGFIQKILPDSGGVKVKLDASFIYSILQNKLRVEGLDGNSGLLLSFKIEKSLFGALDIRTLYVGLKPFVDDQKSIRGVSLESSVMMQFKLGPFSMIVDRLGLGMNLDFPKKDTGNLGWANLDLALKPPTGIGFQVKASVVRGGGFLSIDPENHQYYGAGELNIEFEGERIKYCLTLKVIAIILTQMPDGSKGFSFLIMASLEFNPGIDLPFGFKLTGVGVMVAIHRSMDLEVFQQAVRDDRFNSVLFPDNPVGNAPTIVKSLNSIFPAVQDRYVFALMARIGWGTKKLVDLKLGLIIEVPSPVKVAIAGVLKVTVKAADKQILNLQVNFLIALDLGKKMFSIDASIYNSKLLFFDLKGDMFLRYRWGTDPVFLFAVGGWHPDFQVPAGLNLPAKPQRVSVPLMESQNPSLILSCYFAVTSNTVQAGFAIDFKMKWSKFRLEAGLSVDALFHFDPFYFVVDFEGKLRIFWGDSRLAGVTVKGEFSGTNPWRIKGTATFEIWIWDYDVDFDKSSGEEISEISQEVDVLPLIKTAVLDRGNWQASLPVGRTPNVVLRNTENDVDPAAADDPLAPIVADPMAKLDLVQQVTPLGIRIDKLGFQRARDFRKFDLVATNAQGETLEGQDLEDFFAAGMFLELEDSEKLSRKSFEPMKAGRSFGDTETLNCGPAQVSEFDYDIKIHDPLAPPAKPDKEPLPDFTFQRWILNNSIARSAEGRRAMMKKESQVRSAVPQENLFVVADAVTGNKVTEIDGQKSMAAAYYEVWKMQRENPLRKFNVVRQSELIT